MLTNSLQYLFLITSYNNPRRWPRFTDKELRLREVKYICMLMIFLITYFYVPPSSHHVRIPAGNSGSLNFR